MEGARRDRDACGQGRHEHGQEAPEAGPASYRVSVRIAARSTHSFPKW